MRWIAAALLLSAAASFGLDLPHESRPSACEAHERDGQRPESGPPLSARECPKATEASAPTLIGRAVDVDAESLLGEFEEARAMDLLAASEVAAEELADMCLFGTRTERGWAEAALLAASDDVRRKSAAARLRLETAVEASPSAAPVVADPPPRVGVEFHLLHADADFLRDMGVDLHGLPNGFDSSDFWPGKRVRSAGTFLDDTQIEVLERAATRGRGLSTLERGTARFWSGEEYAMRLVDGAIFTVRSTPSSNRRFASLRLRLRRQDGGTLRFAPACDVAVPDGGTLLIAPMDTTSPDTSFATDVLLLTVTLEP
jgi:hypothetical protein